MKNSMTHAFCYLYIYIYIAKLSCLLLEDNDIRYHSYKVRTNLKTSMPPVSSTIPLNPAYYNLL